MLFASSFYRFFLDCGISRLHKIFWRAQIKVLDKAIEQQFQIIPNTLTSIPGIGKVYSAGIIAEIGDIHRFNAQASVAKYAGLVWTQHQSGDFETQHTKLIKSGNRYLRYYYFRTKRSEVICAMFCGCRCLQRRAKRLKSKLLFPNF